MLIYGWVLKIGFAILAYGSTRNENTVSSLFSHSLLSPCTLV